MNDASLVAVVSRPSVLVVTLNYNDSPRTVAAIESVLAMDYPSFSMMVIDNGSGDGSAAKLAPLAGERMEFVASDVNLGFPAGCNLGLKRALERGFDYVWLVNNDSIVPPGTLSSLVAVAESDATIGMVTPLIASLDEVPHLTFAGGIMDVQRGVYDETNDVAEAQAWADENPGRGLVIGTALLMKMAMVREIGLLDERYFMYFEDMDISARSQAAGYRNVVDGKAIVYHLEKNKSRNPESIKPHYWYYNARGANRFWRKHLGLMRSLKQMRWELNRYLRLRNRITGTDAREAILAGLWHGWLDRGGPYDPAFRMPGPVKAVVALYGRRPALQHKGVDTGR